MKFIQHYSSSTGNLFEVIANNGRRLIIDPGVTWKKLLPALNHKLTGIEACFCSHSHQDHCKSLKDMRKAGIPVYASLGTLTAVGMTGRHIHPLVDKMLVRQMDSFGVYCFNTIHDAPEPMGFVVRENETGEFLLFATDTQTIKQRFLHKFSIIAIECSYNGEYLAKKVREEKINESLAKRLLTSHMEETETLRYLRDFCILAKCREVHLLHLSADNINKNRIVKQFEDELFIKVIAL